MTFNKHTTANRQWTITIPENLWLHMPRELFLVRLAPDGDYWEASIGNVAEDNGIAGFAKTIPDALRALAKAIEGEENDE